ncbi:MAG: hypothetical protein R2685_17735 [Candidatus Nitrosocosmicus sp.]|jgi:hypothetical protein|nr:hypothetical protein [Candidatus Nitrosocosmicus sp.]
MKYLSKIMVNDVTSDFKNTRRISYSFAHEYLICKEYGGRKIREINVYHHFVRY